MAGRGLDRAERRFAQLFFFVALGFGGRMALVAFNGPVAQLFTQNGYLIGLLLAISPLVATFAHPFFGRLSDRTSTRWGRRRPYALVGVPLSALIVFGIPLAPSYEALAALFLVQALFISICGVPLMSLIPDAVGTAARGRVMSLFMIGGGIGAIAIQAAGKLFWELDFGLVYYACGLLTLVAAVPPLLFIREPRPDPAAVAAARARSVISYTAMFRTVARHPPIALFLISGSFRYLGVGLVIIYVTLFAATDLQVSVGDAALAIAVAGGIRLLLALPAGRLVDRYDRKRLLVTATLGAGLGHLMMGVAVESLAGLYAVLAFGAVVGVLEMTSAGPLFMDLMPADRRGELTGINMVLQNLLRASGALLGGALFAWTGTYRMSFPLAALCFAISALVLLRVPRRAYTSEAPPELAASPPGRSPDAGMG
jgi:MFS family permease